MTGSPSGVLDATLVEAFLHPARPLQDADVARLLATFPLPLTSAVPVVAPPHREAERLLAVAAKAMVLEPLDLAAYRIAADALRPGSTGPGPIIVDPIGVRVGERPPEHAVPAPALRESVVWTRPDVPTADQIVALGRTVDALPRTTRVRLRDPHGRITPEVLPDLLAHVPAARLTLWVEDAHGLALAVARAALALTAPPLVRTTLLGVGPRTGGAATELVAPGAFHDAALAFSGATGHRIPERHPLWGPRSRESGEAELLGWAASAPNAGYGRSVQAGPSTRPLEARFAPGTLGRIIEEALEAWGATADPQLVERLTAAVAARLRPGEQPDGPTLYTIAATVLDLRAIATDAQPGLGRREEADRL